MSNTGSAATPSVKPPKKLLLALSLAQSISTQWALKLALKVFLSPLRFTTPEREMSYKQGSLLNREVVNNKRINVYHSEQGQKSVLMVHGWSGRATQFYKMAPAVAKAGYKVYSFTAPAHGSSPEKQTHMLEFADCIEFLDKKYGPFEAIIGHSLGGTATLNAIKRGVKTNKVVLLGTPAYLKDVITDFCIRLNLNSRVLEKIINHIKNTYAEDYEQFSTTRLAENMNIPGLIVHDAEDQDVSIEQAQLNHKVWKNSKMLETKGLGHRLILSDDDVIKEVVSFITDKKKD